MDVSETILANSDQINAEDLLSGPRIVTITGVEQGTTEQPVFIHLAEFAGRTYRPAKTMRRLMVAMWGPDSRTYTGRKLRLFNDPNVKWGGKAVGGVRIDGASHIEKPFTVMLAESRGKRAEHLVEPIPAGPTIEDAAAWLQQASTMAELQQAWAAVQQAGYSTDLAGLKDARKQELQGGTE